MPTTTYPTRQRTAPRTRPSAPDHLDGPRQRGLMTGPTAEEYMARLSPAERNLLEALSIRDGFSPAEWARWERLGFPLPEARR